MFDTVWPPPPTFLKNPVVPVCHIVAILKTRSSIFPFFHGAFVIEITNRISPNLLKSSQKLRFKFRKWQVPLKTLSGRLHLQRNTPDANYIHKRSASRKNRDWTSFTWCTAVITEISKRAVWITDMIIVPTFVSISDLFTKGSKAGSNSFIE